MEIEDDLIQIVLIHLIHVNTLTTVDCIMVLYGFSRGSIVSDSEERRISYIDFN